MFMNHGMFLNTKVSTAIFSKFSILTFDLKQFEIFEYYTGE